MGKGPETRKRLVCLNRPVCLEQSWGGRGKHTEMRAGVISNKTLIKNVCERQGPMMSARFIPEQTEGLRCHPLR